MITLCSTALLTATLACPVSPTAQDPPETEDGDPAAAALMAAIDRRMYSVRGTDLERIYAEFDGRIVNFPGATQDRVYRGRAVWTKEDSFKVSMSADANAASGALTLLGNLGGGLLGEISMLPDFEGALFNMDGPDRIVIRPAASTVESLGSALGWTDIPECTVDLDAHRMPSRLVVTGTKHPSVPEPVPNQMDISMRWRAVSGDRFALVHTEIGFWVLGPDETRVPATIPFHSMAYEYTFEEVNGYLLPVSGRSTITGRAVDEAPPRVDTIVLREVRVNAPAPDDLAGFLGAAQVEALLEPAPPLELGSPAPDWRLTALDGRTLSLEDLRGKVVVLDFWATWCGPCRKALPAIQRLHQRFEDEQVVVLGVALWETEQALADDARAVRDVVTEAGLTYPVAIGSDAIAETYHLSSIPQLFVIDASGTIRMLHEGYSDDLEELVVEQVEELLGGSR